MFVFLTTNVWASAMGDMLISEKGMQIYVIPAGPQGKQNCDLYAYVEMIGEDGKPYIDQNWTLEGKVVRKSDGVTGEMENFDISSGNTGFLNDEIVYATKAEYNDLEMTITIKNGDTVLEEKTVIVADVLLAWPSLSVTKWEAKIAQGEEEVKTGIVFNWNNTELFKRLFQVSVENPYKELEINQKKNGTWELVAKESVDGELLVKLTDALGNTQQYNYKVQVEKQTMSMVLIFVVAGLVVAIVVAILLSNPELREKIKEIIRGREKTPIVTPPKKNEQTAYIRKITSEKSNLISRKEAYDEEEEAYQAKLEVSEMLLRTYGKNTGYAKDLKEFRRCEHLKQDVDYEEVLKDCDNLIEQLRYAPGNVKKWEYSPEYYDNYDKKIRKIQEDSAYFANATRNLKKKMLDFETEKDTWKKMEKVEKQPLKMPISITITKGKDIYFINVSHNDSAFSLDEKQVLNKEYEFEGNTLQDVLKKSTDIKVVARPEENGIALLCPKQNLYFKGRTDTEFLVKKNSRMTFEFADESGSMVVDTY